MGGILIGEEKKTGKRLSKSGCLDNRTGSYMKNRQSKVIGHLCLGLWISVAAGVAETGEHWRPESAYLPKREVAQPEWLEANPDWDGRGVVIAIFDTGVDPSAAGMGVTTTGERKVLDILDASGSGDVDTRTKVRPGEDGSLEGLGGTRLTLPEGITNPEGGFRIGLKRAADLFPRNVLKRLREHEATLWEAELSRLRAERARVLREADRAFEDKAPEDRTRAEKDQAAREELLKALEDSHTQERAPIYYDCVLWHDGDDWRVLVDTDRDGDLGDETALRPYGIAGEYAIFDPVSNLAFGVQVYEQGDLLSIVTVNGTHGTHVASIAAAHNPENPDRNGIAPGAQIVSIRIGDPRTGGSYGDSERRAVALAAQAGVDIVNASWGGRSFYQDGRDANAKTYNMLAERYGILPVVSAGNNGPALSTLGSAGGEAGRVVGVGAYVSREMGKVLYSTLEPNAESTLQFSSRGPGKDGDIGVDVTAPGAALASYSGESLSGYNMSNGTSMSSPCVAGVAALLISAAQQEGLVHDPARVRAALMRGARWVAGENVFTQGAGLVQVPGAWEKLKAMQDEPAFSAYYDLDVSEGSFHPRGRGLYLREPDPKERVRVVVRVAPAWIEAVTAEEKVAFETGFKLHSTVDWIEAPEFFHLANAQNHFIAHVSLPDTESELGSLHFGEIQAFVIGREAIGPAFTVPVTVVRGIEVPEDLEEPLKKTLSMEPAKTVRWFLNAPVGADHLRVKVTHHAEDPIARRFVLHGLTLASEVGIYESGEPNYMRLDEGEERSYRLPTIGGQVMELAVYQYWSSVGPCELEVELEWEGLGLNESPAVFTDNQGWALLPYRSLRDQTVAIEAALKAAVHVHMPVSAEEVPFDERAELPPSPRTPEARRQFMTRQVFELNFEEPLKADILSPQSYDISEFFTGGLTEVIHESGEYLFVGTAWGDTVVEFPKGKSTVIRTFNQVEGEKLEQTRAFPLLLEQKLKDEQKLPVYRGLRARFTGAPVEETHLVAGDPGSLYLQDSALDNIWDMKPQPDFFTGEGVFHNRQKDEIGTTTLLYLAGQPLKETLEKDPKATQAEASRSEIEKLREAVFSQRLGFVRDQRGNEEAAVQEKRLQLVEALITERPEDPEPLFEKALARAMEAGLTGKWWKGPEREDSDSVGAAGILKLLETVRSLADPDAVAAFLGAPPQPTPGDVEKRLELEERRLEVEEARQVLVRVAQLEADIFRAMQDTLSAWDALQEASRWQKEPDSITRSLRTALYEAEGYLGLALQSLDAQLKDEPFDTALLSQRNALLKRLGWDRFARNEARKMAIREHLKHSVLGGL